MGDSWILHYYRDVLKHKCTDCANFVNAIPFEIPLKDYGDYVGNFCEGVEGFPLDYCKSILETATLDSRKGEVFVKECSNYIRSRRLYDQYLTSDNWKKKAEQRKKKDNFQCAMCGTAMNLQVHHTTYDRLFDEDICDLITLCANCHKKVHINDLNKKGATTNDDRT